MKVSVPHTRPRLEVVQILDQPLGTLFAGAVGGLQIADERRSWSESTMTFSFVGRIGFISIPLAGVMEVQETLVIVEVELPPMVNMFVGEEKVRAGLEREIRALVER